MWSDDGLICTGETYKKVVKMTFAKGAALKDPSRRDVPAESMRAALADLGFPAWQADGLIEEFAMYRRGEAAGVEPGVSEALGRAPRAFGQFTRDYASLFS